MKKIKVSFATLGLFFLSASSAFAAPIVITMTPPDILKGITFSSLLSGAIGFILIIAALAAFIYLIWGGIQWITSGGDKTAVESARSRILAAIIGLFVVFAAWAIMLIVGDFFGFSLTRLTFPSAKP